MKNWPFDPAAESYVNLATFRRNGREVRTPVWIAGKDRRYYIFKHFKPPTLRNAKLNPFQFLDL